MSYPINVFKFLFSMDDHLFRIRKAEKVQNLWKVSALLVLCSVFVYVWMAYLGIGTAIISQDATALSSTEYELSKLWFIIGRVLFAVLFAALLLFVPTLYFYLLTDIPYRKLIIMQQVVLLVLLVERILWVPLVLFSGLDWYVSPLSFGVIASYLTETPWIIYFFGAISLFQLWVIWFQVKYLSTMTAIKKHWLWVNVICLHILYWCLAAFLAYANTYIISGWFG
ncbi:hypothetical protein J2Z83_003034 [Virgibacillus natechei]|uniref:Yip1 domain-containing protein n=1 Tax=Virgibacillus natechei TaxID=1216297 RepID=A0ABS4IJ36_9BACI|nr:hypothetical protein [Virgibacillus natechei]MBP1970898.1 hypothetical protein [Virgibacillus natechei]UZD13281.1 hypothetical protein OLD84_01565 [Virgibacillus natechei]